MNELAGKVALVSGSSRGIGAVIAATFAAAGARVAVHGRDAAGVDGVRRRIAATGADTIGVLGDLTSWAAVEKIRADIEAALGPVDILIANAGGNPVPPGPIEDITEETWHATIETNLTATFLMVKSFLPGMKRRGSGIVVTMSSAAARRAHAGSPAAYAAAKAGIELLTKELALQAGPFGVRVNCLAPETILTTRNLQRIPEGARNQLRDTHPLRRLGTPLDVAGAALFLSSDASSWITGVVLDIAGGAVVV